MLERDIFAAARDARARRLHIGLGLRELCPIVPVVDAEQDVTRPHRLIVLDLDSDDIAADLGRKRGDVTADIGIVRLRRLVAGCQQAEQKCEEKRRRDEQQPGFFAPGQSRHDRLR